MAHALKVLIRPCDEPPVLRGAKPATKRAKQTPSVADATTWPRAGELTPGHIEKHLLSRLWES